ncbi:hypothetical protein [Providencia phage PSTRCR_114]|uniref:Uncharacterized protein n=1 Tax=Providencia phage PSTRCR_114 TaxID=2800824 RepID=A0A7T6ZM78_9CAUD|nr:hypothetical protein [Providencia phage PSTRCR_114]
MIKHKRKVNKLAIVQGLEFYRDRAEDDLLVMDRATGYTSGVVLPASAYPTSRLELQRRFLNRNLTHLGKYPLVLTACTRVKK